MAQTQNTQGSEPSEELIAGRDRRPHSGSLFRYPHPENPSPYSKDSQIMVFGIHGTENSPENVRQLTNTVADNLRGSRRGNPVEVDTFFNWKDEAGLFNQPGDRTKVAKRFADYVVDNIEEKFKSGEFVKGKPLVIDLVGFSHGGNVAIQAAPEISERLKEISKKYGVNADIHLTTASTPAYYSSGNIENPNVVAKQVRADGVGFEHTHFSVEGDGVIRGAFGNSHYPEPPKGITRNFDLPRLSQNNGIANHGAPQDEQSYMNIIGSKTVERYKDIAASRNLRADALEGQSTELAQVPRTLDWNSTGSGRPDLARLDGNSLVDGNAALNRQFEQALKGANGDKDAAALAVQTISQAPGFKPDQDINVVQGKNGLIVSQGDGPSAINLQVPQAKPGDFERVSTQLAQTPVAQPVASQPDQPERSKLQAM